MSWVDTLRNGEPLGRRVSRKPPPLPAVAFDKREWKHLSLRQLQGMRNLLFCARTVVEGAYSGRHRSPYKGASPEFVDYREYYPGDDMRSIDWKAAARSDRLLVRLYEKQTDMNCYLMVDTSASMNYGGAPTASFLKPKDLSKLDYALCLAASLAYLIVKQGDKASLTLFAEGIRHHLPPGGTFPHLYAMLNLMERQRGQDRTQVARTLRAAYGLCRRKGLLLVFSDLLDEGPDLFQALNLYRHHGYEVILFHILPPHELALPDERSIDFVDSETSETLNTHPADIAASYRREVEGWIEGMRRDSLGHRVDYHLVSTGAPYEQVLQHYLLRRSRL
jgi:uncharacterized protein (DUF58 family)